MKTLSPHSVQDRGRLIRSVELLVAIPRTRLVSTSSSAVLPEAMSLADCQALVADDMHRVDRLIGERLRSDVALIDRLGAYIIGAGGKRLRPRLVLLSAGACGYQGGMHIATAAIIEFIHTATLLHDDVVDASELRRGNRTANAVWGNEAAVLVGDFLYSRSFEMMVEVRSLEVMEILAGTTNRIAEGEVMQLLNVHEPDISEARYIEVIEAKTGRLFRAATELGAVLAERDVTLRQALADFGMHLGTAFQIADDVLDYTSDSDELGKNVGDDLAEGKTTLPLIYAMRDGTDAQRHTVSEAIREGGLDALDEVLAAIRQTDALERSMQRASESAAAAIAALAPLPRSRWRDALETIARYSVERGH